MFLHSRSISAVLPDPTGPPTPTRRGPWDLLGMLSPLSSRTSERSERDPGPITTEGNCCTKLELQPRITTNACGYGSRPSPGRRKQIRHDLNNLVYCVSCRRLARSA